MHVAERFAQAGGTVSYLQKRYIDLNVSSSALSKLIEKELALRLSVGQTKTLLLHHALKKGPEAARRAQGARHAGTYERIGKEIAATDILRAAGESKAAYARRLREVLPGYSLRQLEKTLDTLYPPVSHDRRPKLAAALPELASWYRGSAIAFEELIAGSSRTLPWCCPEGHEFTRAPKELMTRESLCPVCGNSEVLTGWNDLESQQPEVARDWSSRNTLRASEVYSETNAKGLWLCTTCAHEWEQVVRNRTVQGAGCPKCSARSSRHEATVLALLASLYGGEVVSNSYPLRDEDGRRYQVDILLPALKLGFEVQDFATHSRTSDQEPLEEPWRHRAAQRGQSLFKKGPTYHALKQRLCREAGIALVELWEDDLRSGALRRLMSEAISRAESEEL